MDYFRSLPHGKPVPLDDVEGHVAVDDRTHQNLERKMLLDHVEKCLGNAEPRSQQVFWLYHQEGMKPKEIAALPGLGMGMSGVETVVYRLTIQVRDCLRKAGVLNR